MPKAKKAKPLPANDNSQPSIMDPGTDADPRAWVSPPAPHPWLSPFRLRRQEASR